MGYYQTFIDKQKKSQEDYYKVNKEKQRQRSRDWYWRNREYVLERQKQKKINNSEYYKQWYQKNKIELNKKRSGDKAGVRSYNKPNNSTYKIYDNINKPKSFTICFC